MGVRASETEAIEERGSRKCEGESDKGAEHY